LSNREDGDDMLSFPSQERALNTVLRVSEIASPAEAFYAVKVAVCWASLFFYPD